MSLNCPTPSCDRVMPGHLRVCRACSAGLLRDLADVPSLDTHLDIAIARQSRMGDRDGARSTEMALPWDQRAREAANILRSTLVGWHRIVTEESQTAQGPVCVTCEHPSCEWIDLLGRAPADTLTSLARWLLRHRARLLGHQAAAEAVDELTDAVRQARRAIDRPLGMWYAGLCGTPYEGRECTADLYARHGATTMRCRVCEATHDVAAREAWLMDQVADVLGTAAEIARALNGFTPSLTSAKVRGLAHRGRILAKGENELGRPLYRVGDVLDLVSA